MNNESQGRERLRARDLTEEIDRVTEQGQTVKTSAQEQRSMATGREQAQQIGWRALDGGRQERAMGGARATESVRSAEELQRDEKELTEAQEFVGQESKIQTKERLADDLEDARNEAGEGLAFENRIVAKNQEGVAQMVAPEVDKLVAQKSFRPSDLERLYRKGVNTILGVFNRKIGDRN